MCVSLLPFMWTSTITQIFFGLGLEGTAEQVVQEIHVDKMTGKFNNKIATVMILWYLVILFGAFQLPNCMIPHNFKMLSQMHVLDGMHYRWRSLSTMFFFSLSGGQLICGVFPLFLVKTIAKMTEDLKAGNEWHFFISHMQRYGGDQCATLSAQLKQRGWAVWWDQNMDEINTDAMKEGVQKSAVFMLFMTKDVFHRPYVRLEIEEAMKFGKPILLLHENDKKECKFDFSAEERKSVTQQEAENEHGFKLKFSFKDELYQKKIDNMLSKGRASESIPWQRRVHLQEVVLHKVKQKFYQSLGAGEFYSALSKIIKKGDNAIEEAFKDADVDRDDNLNKKELQDFTKLLGLKLDQGQLESIFTSIDRDGDGGISLAEFTGWLKELKNKNKKKVQ